MSKFFVGLVLGLIAVPLVVYAYLASGHAPVATSAEPMPFEKMMAHKALNAVIDREMPKNVPIQGDEPNFTAGAMVYRENCAVCHGADGQGDREKGAPRLASRVHLYGDDRATVVAQVTSPRMGVMPAWHTRLDEATIKSLTLYVHSLGGGE